jgi:hypothetical protein
MTAEEGPPRLLGRSVDRAPGRGVVAALFFALAAPGCDKGCGNARVGVREVRNLGAKALGDLPIAGTDCPDGLARCEQGVISVSRLATIPAPCSGPPETCRCPWDRIVDCPNGCAADGVEVVMERGAAAQLCALRGGVLPAVPSQVPIPAPAPCDEGDRFECRGNAVVECAGNLVIGTCLRGCQREGGAIDDDRASRVAAFAILCSR